MWGGAPWPWYVVIWPDGRKELPQEDYGPYWYAVREWDAGRFIYQERPSTVKRSPFGWTSHTTDSEDIEYQAMWLPREQADAEWKRLGLQESDF